MAVGVLLPNPNPPVLAAAVPSPNTLPPFEPSGLEKFGAEPNAGTPPNPGDPPNVGGLPNTGAAPNPPVLVGLEKPNPCVATLPPALNVPVVFCSPNDVLPNPKLFAPLLPKRLFVFAELGDPKPVLDDPNGFLLAASWLGLPPRPLKKPPPVLLLLEPKSPPLVEDACPKTFALPLCDWPNTDPVELEPNADGCAKLNAEDDVVVVVDELALPKTGALCPNVEPWPKTGVLLCPNRPPPEVDALLLLDGCPNENELALLVFVDPPNRLPPLLVAAVEAGACPKAGWDPKADGAKEKLLAELAGAFQRDAV